MELKEKNDLRELTHEEKFKQVTGQTFNTFYKKYYPKLVWQIQRMSINQIDAEGLANEAFMQCLDKIHQYNPEYHYSTWLFTAGKNLAYKFKKDNKSTITVDTNSTGSENDNVIAFEAMQYHNTMKIDNHDIDLESYNITKLKYTEAMKEIEKLSPKYKTIMELRCIHNYEYNEICKMLGIELQTVKNRLFHGRAKMENSLKRKFNHICENY